MSVMSSAQRSISLHLRRFLYLKDTEVLSWSSQIGGFSVTGLLTTSQSSYNTLQDTQLILTIVSVKDQTIKVLIHTSKNTLIIFL